MSGQLRGPLEQWHLVTQRDRVTGKYGINQYWLDRITGSSGALRALGEKLRALSEAGDKAIAEISGEWIQVRRSQHPNGMLVFTWHPPGVALLAAFLRNQRSLDEFVDQALQQLIVTLELDLERIRDRINGEGKTRISALLTDLQAEVNRMSLDHGVSDLRHALRSAASELMVVMDRVADWFQLAKAQGGEPYDVEDAVEIARETVQGMCPAFRVRLNITPAERDPFGGDITPLVDIFFILLENVARHSELDAPTAHIDITVGEDLMSIAINNNVSNTVDLDSSERRLAAIRKTIVEGAFMTSVTSEGGTGLCKVAKVLTRDLAGQPVLEFGFGGDRQFSVKLQVSVVRLSSGEEETPKSLPGVTNEPSSG